MINENRSSTRKPNLTAIPFVSLRVFSNVANVSAITMSWLPPIFQAKTVYFAEPPTM